MRLPGSRMPWPCSELTRMHLGAEQFGEHAARREADLVPLGEDHFEIGVELAVRQPRRAMIQAPRQLADFGMQRAAERDVHLLKTAADAEQRHAARDAGLDQRQRQRIAAVVVRLAARVLFVRRSGSGWTLARAPVSRMPSTVSRSDADIGDLRRAGKHQRHARRRSRRPRADCGPPTRCAVNLPSTRCALPMTPTTGFLRLTLRPQPCVCQRLGLGIALAG